MVSSISSLGVPTFPSATQTNTQTNLQANSQTSSQNSQSNPNQSSVATQALTSVPAGGILSTLPVQTSAGALLGGGAATSVLGASEGDDATSLFGTVASQQSTLLLQVQANANAQLQQVLDAINSEAASENAGINTQNDVWINVKSQINNAEIAVQNGQESATKVADTLLDMRTSVANAGQKGEDLSYWKDQYDSQVTSINNEAESADPATNLVGNLNPIDFSPNTIEYDNKPSSATTLTGTYIGNTWRIKADDGTYWVPDVTTDTLQAYKGLQGDAENYTTGDGQSVPKATSTRNGLSLVSYDPSTNKITVNVSVVPTDPPITVTGTLEQNGIGVMQSWFYNNFATQADRDRAFADITKSEVNLTSAQATLQNGATQTTQGENHANAALDALTQQTVAVQTKQQSDTQAAQAKAAQQFLAMQASLQNLQAVQSNYLQAFAGFVSDDPFAATALNITA